MTFDPAAHRLAFVLPMSFKKGDITFIALRTGQRVCLTVPPSVRPRHVVSTDVLDKGNWRAMLHWSDGQTQYHQEQEIFVV